MTLGDVFCERCGAKMLKYRHKLNKPMVRALLKIYSVYGENPVRISEVGLTHNQICNFQKLRYWGLVDKFKDNAGDRRGGVWFITMKGSLFLENRCALPLRVWTWRGEKCDEEQEQASILEIDAGYQFRPEWVEQAKLASNNDDKLRAE